MQDIYFVSGNKGKFLEYQTILKNTANILQEKVSLIEVQAANSFEICKKKLAQAQKIFTLEDKNFFVEDTALYFNAWNYFPGVYIKWMLDALGVEKIYQTLAEFDKTATAECTIGYFSKHSQKSYFFVGKLAGCIVQPKGVKGFGWDSLFMPHFCKKSYAQMDSMQKNTISHRALAAKKFQDFLQKSMPKSNA